MNSNVYANRKRKKPQKSVKPTPPEGAKTNPSKRHRDRLNGELERLANLLPFPQDVISRLDKLTVLRLCVSYLRAKSFFNVTLKSSNTKDPESNGLIKVGPELPEGELLLQVLNGFILVVTAGGTIFYASSTIQDYLGFHQSDVIHQSVYDLIHTDDRAEFQRQLHWALKPSLTPDTGQLVAELLPPENSAFLERNFVCRLRCLLDNFSGFIALNFQGRLKLLHGQNERTQDGKPLPPQPALFALASPLQPPSILEIRTKNLMFRTKHKLDFTPTDCDAKGKIVLGYTEAELCYRGSGYQFIHAADMLHCAENHMRMMKMGESGMTVFRLLTKHSGWVWVQANARLVYKNGRPDCIIVSEKVLTNEEGEENLRKRHLELPFCFTTGEAVLYDSAFPKGSLDSSAGATGAQGSGDRAKALDPDSLLGSLMKQDESIYACAPSSSSSSQSKPPLALDDGAGQPDDECDDGGGGIFSSRWQEGVLSLSESALFRREPRGGAGAAAAEGRGGDTDGELWSFMRSMGINREDFELFRQDETFLNVDLGGRDDLPDLTDEILSYVQESLRKGPDGAFSYGARFGDPGGRNPARPCPPSSADSRWRPLEAHPQAGDRCQPPACYQQPRPYAQPLPQKRPPSTERPGRELPQQSLSGRVLPSQQLQPHGGMRSQPLPHHQQQQQLCRSLKRMQVNGSSRSQGQHAAAAITGGQQIPPLFRLDQPGRPQLCGRPQHEHLCLGEPAARLPLEHQLNAVSVSCASVGLQSQGEGDLSVQDLEELLGSLDPGQQQLGPEGGGGAAQWSVEARSTCPPQHLTYPESSSLGLAQLSHPVAISSTEQPFMMQFQNHGHGIVQVTGPGSSEEGDCGPPGQQGPAESWPYPDVSLRGFL